MALCTVERLMRELGITSAVRGKKIITTIPDNTLERAPDLPDRKFLAPTPNRCRTAGFTHVKTWSGDVYVAFVVDTFSRRIIGWSAATSKRPWRTLSQVELAKAEWANWYCHRRVHGEIVHVPPAEYETSYYLTTMKPQVTTTI